MLRNLRAKIETVSNKRFASSFYQKIFDPERSKQDLVPKILDFEQVTALCEELMNPKHNENDFLLDQFKNRIVPGVDDTSRLKANFLFDITIAHAPSEDGQLSRYLRGSQSIGVSATMFSSIPNICK